MEQKSTTFVENNFESFNEIKFSKELNLQNINVVRRIFKKALKAIADKSMKQRKSAELVKWARDLRKSRCNKYFNSRKTKVYFYKVIRKSIFTSTKLLSAQEKNEFYRELLETEMEEGSSEERGDEEKRS
ncbi:hypothetical protein G6F43_005098 [Rhizopus delemar]|nr:hypothetical protein G6F43_005098 [Rhizopus delemar]